MSENNSISHKNGENSKSVPYQVTDNEQVGRYMIATR